MLSLKNYGSSSEETDSDTETSETGENDSVVTKEEDDDKSSDSKPPNVVPEYLQPISDPAMSVANSLAIVAAPDVVAAVIV